jgi:hypothetical protein
MFWSVFRGFGLFKPFFGVVCARIRRFSAYSVENVDYADHFVERVSVRKK